MPNVRGYEARVKETKGYWLWLLVWFGRATELGGNPLFLDLLSFFKMRCVRETLQQWVVSDVWNGAGLGAAAIPATEVLLVLEDTAVIRTPFLMGESTP